MIPFGSLNRCPLFWPKVHRFDLVPEKRTPPSDLYGPALRPLRTSGQFQGARSERGMARREWNVARNGQFGWLAKSAGFRRNPQQHAGTGAIRQEKTPTENGWGFVIGGGGRSRTAVRRHSISGTTCLAHRWVSSRGSTACEAHPGTSLFWVDRALTGNHSRRSCDDDPTSTSTGTSGFGATP